MPQKRVLFIDDDEELLSLIKFILWDENIDVIISPVSLSPVEILEIAPDLILLDEWLMDIKGSQICAMLKADIVLRTIPVVLISALPQLAKIAQRSNADAFISKPFDIYEFIAIIRSLI